MKEISEDAKLSNIYTNHCIHKTTAMGMKRQGFDLNEIKNVTKHKNLDSLKHYISGPTYKEKKNYNEALLNYAQNNTEDCDDPPPKRRSNCKAKQKMKNMQPKTSALTLVVQNQQNLDPDNCLVPVLEDSDDSTETNFTPALATQHSNVVNQMRQASNMFQSATFHNCNFTFQMPK